MEIKNKGYLNSLILFNTILIIGSGNSGIPNFIIALVSAYTGTLWLDWKQEEKRKIPHLIGSFFAPLSSILLMFVVDDILMSKEMIQDGIRVLLFVCLSYYIFYDILKKTKI